MTDYISIRQIMDDILDHPLMADLPLERAVNYAVRFIRIVGMPKLFTDKIASLLLEEYRCALPCDYIEMILATDDKGHSYRYTTDTFHLDREDLKFGDLTYKILNRVLYSNKKDGIIKISYRAIGLDEDGFPLIEDNSSFIQALELFIKKEWFTILFDLNKISANVLNNTKLDYAWYVGLAQSDLVRPSIDEMESFTNMWNQLLTKSNEHRTLFLHTGSKEYVKTH